MKPLARLLFVAAALLAVAGLLGFWVMFAPNTPRFEGPRSVKIPPGASFRQATDSLEAAGLLSSRRSFELAAVATGWARQIKPGHYRFQAGASNFTMLDRIRKGRQDPIRVMIPPGVRPHVLAAVLQRDLDLDAREFLDALRDPELAADLGTDTLHLFGFMRPNSFDIYWTSTPRAVVRRLKTEWNRFWTDERQRKADNLGLSKEQVLVLASIVEWEARVADERPRIAGVYLNRLLGRTRAGRMRLQADPTVQFAVMQTEGGRMRRLFYVDYAIDHPFNTYRIDGLPPGPITNPSEGSIDAVLNAEEHDYLYMVARGDGTHVFSRTLAEHNRAVAAFRALMEQRRRELAAREQQ